MESTEPGTDDQPKQAEPKPLTKDDSGIKIILVAVLMAGIPLGVMLLSGDQEKESQQELSETGASAVVAQEPAKEPSCDWDLALIDTRRGKKVSMQTLQGYLKDLVTIQDAKMMNLIDDREGWLTMDWDHATAVYKDKDVIIHLARNLETNRSLVLLVDLNSGTYRIDISRLRNTGYKLNSYVAKWKCE